MLSFTAPDSSGVFRWSSFDLSYSFSVLWPKRSFKNVKGSWTPLCLPAALEAKAQCLNVATAPRGPPSLAFCLSPGSLLLVRKPKGHPQPGASSCPFPFQNSRWLPVISSKWGRLCMARSLSQFCRLQLIRASRSQLRRHLLGPVGLHQSFPLLDRLVIGISPLKKASL